MNVLQSFTIALDMLRLHKMRAFLTMLGVIIGVMAVTTIIMISNGFQDYLKKQFSNLGANTIYIAFDPGRRGQQSVGALDGLTMDDITFLQSHTTSLGTMSPRAETSIAKATVSDREVNSVRVFGVDERYAAVAGLSTKSGRFVQRSDIDTRMNVCLIGEELQQTLFLGASPIGKYVNASGITLEVVGVLTKKDVFGQTNAKDIYLPITTLQSKWTGDRKLTLIATEPRAGIKTEQAMDDVWRALMLRSNNKKIYRVDSNESITKTFTGIFGAAGLILAAIATLSLVVGGIGIMNIMLVSVTERTKEIGLRKALGARKSSILLQFLVEAGTLSLVGGLIGMGIAWLIGQGVHALSAANEFPDPGGLAISFPPTAALGASLISFLIGVVFGLFPAMSAAKLDPIVALRRE